MADFRKWVLALTVLVLFAGLASAQVNNGSGGGTALSCTANAAVPPQLRSEGYTELTGDILIQCTGGVSPGTVGQGTSFGAQIPTANITVYLNGTVTSRLLTSSSTGQASEAMLLIDEPGSGDSGYGPSVPVTVCSTSAQASNSCTEFIGDFGITGAACAAGATPTSIPAGCNVPVTSGGTQGYNAFQGSVSGSSVTFFGVPVLAPGTTGTRVYRITNVRVNANGLSAGGPLGSAVIAALTISGSQSIPLNNPQLTVGSVQPSLTSAVRNFAGGSVGSGQLTQPIQCNEPNGNGKLLGQADIRYTELFGTAFKTRVSASAPSGGTGQAATAQQNIPGFIYNSESGYIPYVSGAPALTGNGFTAGLADFGTRLKATFNNIPTGVSVYVTTTNIIPNGTTTVAATASTSFAVLVAAENAAENNTVGGSTQVSQLTATGTTTNGGSGVGSLGTALSYYQVPIVNNSATAVWEVVNTYPNLLENFEFGVFISYTASPSTNSPAPGTMTVNMSYAPNPTGGLFTAAQGGVASNSLPIPRFADTSSATNVAQVTICSTALLFPFVTNLNGFDTGIAIANTSVDPFGTAAQTGTCSLNWYGNATTTSNPAASTLGSGGVGSTTGIAAGTVATALASVSVPGFNGYMIAVCNFQFAHGFAFVSDLGARNLAMGYLALVMNAPSSSYRPTGAAEALEN